MYYIYMSVVFLTRVSVFLLGTYYFAGKEGFVNITAYAVSALSCFLVLFNASDVNKNYEPNNEN